MKDNTTIKELEQGRAKFAYECAYQNLSIKNFEFKYQEIKTAEIIKKAFGKKFVENIKEEHNKALYDDFISNPIEKNKEFSQKDKKTFEKKLSEFYAKYGKEYRSNVKKIPMYIKTNGLGATFAFVKSKAKDGNAWELIYKQIFEWLIKDDKKFIGLPDGKDLILKIISLNSPEYRAVTVEVLAFFNWLKRFADGLIEEEAEK